MKIRSSAQDWRAYRSAVAEGELPSLRELGLPVGRRKGRRFFAGGGENSEAVLTVQRLIELWNQTEGKDSEVTEDELKLVQLGTAFLSAVNFGQVDRAQRILDEGFPINFQHPRSRETAIHIAVSKPQLNDFSLQLLDSGKCDLLLRDRFGRLALNTALFFNPGSDALIERLALETRQQADAEGIDLAEEESRYRREWTNQNWFIRLARQTEYVPE